MRASILAVLLAVPVLTPAAAQTPKLADLPAALKPASGNVYLELAGSGVQIYTCGKTDAGAWAWIFKAPDATLTDTAKKPFGKHYAGPTWEGNDGGKVVGTVKASAPAPGGNAIPWLLLDIKSREGAGALTQAQGILRVATAGGVAPAQGCDEAHAGTENRVPYTGTYLFLK